MDTQVLIAYAIIAGLLAVGIPVLYYLVRTRNIKKGLLDVDIDVDVTITERKIRALLKAMGIGFVIVVAIAVAAVIYFLGAS